MEGRKSAGIGVYALLMLLIAILYFAYWLGFGTFLYRSFASSYFDIGLETYLTYAHLHYINASLGLGYLAFSGHLSPFRVLLLPVSALFEGPIALLAVQDIALVLAAIVIYLCGRDILKSEKIGLAFAIAFLLNPGAIGPSIFDFHNEAFVPLFYILCFYFYMKKRRGYLLLSFFILLSIAEYATMIGLSFVAGMLYYEYAYNSRGIRDAKWKMDPMIRALYLCAFLALIYLAFYLYARSSLLAMYSSDYASVPAPLKYFVFDVFYWLRRFNIGLVFVLALFGLLLLFFGLGFFGLRDPIMGFIFVSPWLVGVLVLQFLNFIQPYFQYYSYGIGGATAVSFLTLIIFFRNKKNERELAIYERICAAGLILTSVIEIVVIFVYIPMFVQLKYFNPANWNVPSNYSQIDAALHTIPRNASVLAEPGFTPHLYYIEKLEIPPTVNGSLPYTAPWITPGSQYTATYWFRPNFIVVDRQIGYFSTFNTSNYNIYSYMDSNYTLYNSTEGLEIYRLRPGR